MGKLIKLARRALASSTTIATVGLLAHGLFSNEAGAQTPPTPPDCTTLTNPVYITGSTAVQPVLAGLGKSLAGTTTVVYITKNGSCVGVADALGAMQPATTNGVYWLADGTQQSCSLAAPQAIDIGVSDVYATTCPAVTQAQLTAASVGDFDNFFAQTMEFVVPVGSDQTTISAEAAYLTFGLAATGGTPWDTQTALYERNATSGTEAMLAAAIKLDPSKWKGIDAGGSGAMVTAIGTPTGDPKKTIGILSSGEIDGATSTIKKLAFQGYGQTCAYWPDSAFSEKDKRFMRDGHYQVWGPLHMLAKVNGSGVATNTAAKAVLDLFAAQDKSTVDIEISAHVVPLCAMNVARTSELGPLSSIQPVGSCGCYFDSTQHSSGADADCKVCTVATQATDCTDPSRSKCNYGYCEAK
jgi:ABC-type phosphate transport system substrate-binding protein